MNRKEFFRFGLKKALEKGIDILEKTGALQKLESISSEQEKKAKRQRPPGAAHSEQEFLNKCTGCDACMKACPVNIIMIDDLERRDPIIFPDQQPCIHCPGYPCISSCPTGALNRKNGFSLREL